MLGIALVSQFITYQIYPFLPPDQLRTYQEAYMIRAFFLIAPIMLIEMFTGLQMIIRIGDFRLHRLVRADMAILIAIWLITFLFELPLHLAVREETWNVNIQQSLLIGNFARVLLWSVKGYLVIKMIPHFYAVTNQ